MKFCLETQNTQGTDQLDMLIQTSTQAVQAQDSSYGANAYEKVILTITIDPAQQEKEQDYVYSQTFASITNELSQVPVQMYYKSGDKDHYNMLNGFETYANGKVYFIYLDELPTASVTVDLVFFLPKTV